MSDTMKTAEIEDVLSSIRRLVSEETGRDAPRPAQADAAEAPAEGARSALVLTPDFRVAGEGRAVQDEDQDGVEDGAAAVPGDDGVPLPRGDTRLHLFAPGGRGGDDGADLPPIEEAAPIAEGAPIAPPAAVPVDDDALAELGIDADRPYDLGSIQSTIATLEAAIAEDDKWEEDVPPAAMPPAPMPDWVARATEPDEPAEAPEASGAMDTDDMVEAASLDPAEAAPPADAPPAEPGAELRAPSDPLADIEAALTPPEPAAPVEAEAEAEAQTVMPDASTVGEPEMPDLSEDTAEDTAAQAPETPDEPEHRAQRPSILRAFDEAIEAEDVPEDEAAFGADTLEIDPEAVSDAELVGDLAAIAPARLTPTGAAGAAAETDLMDEEALRDLIVEIVRQELQGALGERITRNVRKLVRREINRALASRELE